MKQIFIKEKELWDEKNRRFIVVKPQTITLEHSLVSISKWESKWHVPFFSKEPKTTEMTLDYIRAMTITQNVNPNVYECLTTEDFREINAYIDDPQTATTINEKNGRASREIITSELVYFWMVQNGIPFECQKWPFNRLLTLIRICQIKSQPEKKMSQQEIYSRNRALNAARKSKLNTRG